MIPNCVAESLVHLNALIPEHLALVKTYLSAEGGTVYKTDLWISAGVRRSMQLITGFVVMVETRNMSCALAILRLELDTALRLFALTLVDDADKFVGHVFSGERFHKLKDRSDKQMTDAYLVERIVHEIAVEADQKSDWIKRIYEEGCEFVHMSRKHIKNVLHPLGDQQYAQGFSLIDELWIEDEMLRAVEDMMRSTELVLEFVRRWCEQKAKSSALDADPT